jgi:AraC-like DNA-binding protein
VSSSTTPHHHVQRMLDEIHQHYNQRLTLAGLARVLSRQSAYLGRLFRDEVGLSVHQYVTRARMIFAAAQVRAGVKIEAVSLDLGYRSKKNFYSQFKRQFGMTPDVYRRAVDEMSQEIAQGERRDRPDIKLSFVGAGVAMLVTDERGRCVGATEEAVALTGYAAHELRGMPAELLFPGALSSGLGCRLQVLHPTSASRPATTVLQTKSAGRIRVHLTTVDLSGTQAHARK